MKTFLKLAAIVGCLIFTAPAPSAGAEPAKPPSRFEFAGGDLNHFLNQIRAAFGVDLRTVGTVPDAMLYSVRVPKMRLGDDRSPLDFRQVLDLYNRISDRGQPSLGRWIIEGRADAAPQALLLVAHGPKEEAALQVKAFPFPGGGGEGAQKTLKALLEIVEQQRNVIQALSEAGEYPAVSPADLRGRVQYHEEAGILVVTGGKVYVDLVSAIVEALRQKSRLADIVPSGPASERVK